MSKAKLVAAGLAAVPVSAEWSAERFVFRRSIRFHSIVINNILRYISYYDKTKNKPSQESKCQKNQTTWTTNIAKMAKDRLKAGLSSAADKGATVLNAGLSSAAGKLGNAAGNAAMYGIKRALKF